MATGEDGPAAGKGAAMGRITTAVGEAAGARHAVGVPALGGGRHGTGQQRQASRWTPGSLDGRGRGGGRTGRPHGPALAAHGGCAEPGRGPEWRGIAVLEGLARD